MKPRREGLHPFSDLEILALGAFRMDVVAHSNPNNLPPNFNFTLTWFEWCAKAWDSGYSPKQAAEIIERAAKMYRK